MTEVFLITIDALRHDHFYNTILPKYWDEGLNEFVHLKNAYSNGVATPFSFPSIHTGHPVVKNGSLQQDIPTIAELYEGYTFAVTNNGQLSKERGYHRGYDSFTTTLTKPNDSKNSNEIPFGSEIVWNLILNLLSFADHFGYDNIIKIVDKFITNREGLSYPYERSSQYTLSTLKNKLETQSGFFWVHLTDAHWPYYPQKITDKEKYTKINNMEIKETNRKFIGMKVRSQGTDGPGKDLPPPTQQEIDFCREIYGELCEYVFRMISDFFQFLKSNGRWQENIVIVMSDHGEAFGEECIFEHDFTAIPTDTLIKVPLAVKFPNNRFAGESHFHTVQNADLKTTLSKVLEWDIDQPLYTRPFLEQGNRPIISKSNTAIRVTTDEGYALRRYNTGEKIIKQVGDITDEALALLKSSSFPTVKTGGKIVGRTVEKQEKLEKNLEYLGYK